MLCKPTFSSTGYQVGTESLESLMVCIEGTKVRPLSAVPREDVWEVISLPPASEGHPTPRKCSQVPE